MVYAVLIHVSVATLYKLLLKTLYYRAVHGLAILLVINQQVKAASNICDSPKCAQEAAKIVDYVDTSANPCEDFYQFACGNFVANSSENDEIELSHRLAWYDIRELELQYQEDVREDDHKMVKVAKMLYGRCMKRTEIKNDFIETIKQALVKVGGWPILEGSSWNDKDFDWLNATYQLRRLGYDYGTFFDVVVVTDESNTNKRIFKVIPGPRYYLLDEEKTLMAKIALYLGAENEETAIKEVNDVYEFLQKYKELDRQDYVRQTVAEYQKGEDAIDWLEFINNVVGPKIQITKNDSLYFPNKKNLKQFRDFISNTPKRTLANSIMWEVVHPLLPFIPNCPGSYRMCGYGEERDMFCFQEMHLRLITELLSPIDVLRLRRYLSEEKKKTIENMIVKINSEFKETVKKIEWIPDKIRQKVTNKVENIKVVIGWPGNYFDDKILDELDVDMGDVEESSSFFTLLAQANRNRQSASYMEVNKLRGENDYREYILNLPVPSYRKNLLYIPVGATKYFLYDENRPEYLNYGRLGTMVGSALGKELLSYIDIEMRTGEFINNFKDCLLLRLSNDTADNYFKETVLTSTFESIIGQHVSYAVYQQWIKDNEEEPKLVATNYTPNQLFWISAASLKCTPPGVSKIKGSKDMQNKIKRSIYSLSESLRENPNFAKDFNCHSNSGLNTAAKCEIL